VVQRGGRVNVSMRLGCRSQRWLRRYDAPPRPMRPGAAEPSPSVLEGRAHEWGPAPGQCEHSGSMAWRHSQALGQRLVDAERFAGREGHRPWIGAIRSFYRPGAVRVGLSLCILSLVSRCWLLGRRHAGLNYDYGRAGGHHCACGKGPWLLGRGTPHPATPRYGVVGRAKGYL